MHEQTGKFELAEIIAKLQKQVLTQSLVKMNKIAFLLDSEQENILNDFLNNNKKVCLILARDSNLLDNYFKLFIQKLWKQEEIKSNITIPIYIELLQLKNPFTDLLSEGLSLYGLNQEEQEILINAQPVFILILTGYDQLKLDKLKNLYVTNKLDHYNIKKIIITCSSDYLANRANYRLFFVCYQNKEPQRKLFQEIKLVQNKPKSTISNMTELKIQPVKDEYWHRILVEDLEILLNDFKVKGFAKPPTLDGLQHYPLNKELIIANNSELNARADIIKKFDSDDGKSESFLFKQLCFLFLRYSKQSEFVEVGAANSITILNYARVSFSGMDLSRIKISNANLSGAILHRTNLFNTNLENVNFSSAFLIEANLNYSKMGGLQFQEKPALQHDFSVYQCIYSIDGSLLITASGNCIRLWDTESQQVLKTLKNSLTITSIDLSYDRQLLLFGGGDKMIRIWNLTTNQESRIFEGHEDEITSVKFSPDEKILASGSRDNSVRLWNINTGLALKVWKESSSRKILSVDFSFDGKLLAFSGEMHSIGVWEVYSDQKPRILTEHLGEHISCVRFSPDGKLLGLGAGDDNVYLYETENFRIFQILRGHSHFVTSLHFHPNGKLLASSSRDNTIRLWEMDSGRQMRVLRGHTDLINSVYFSQNGKYMASASNDTTVRLWEISNYKNWQSQLEKHTSKVSSINFSPDGEILASSSFDNTVRLWRTFDGQELSILRGHTLHVTDNSFHPNGKLLASSSWDETIKIWEVNNTKQLFILEGHENIVNNVNFSPNGNILASCSADETIGVWKINDLKQPLFLRGHKKEVICISFSPDGKLLASGSSDWTVKLWDMTSIRSLHTFLGHKGEVNSIKFSPKERLLVSASADKNIRIWNIDNKEEFNILEGHKAEVCSINFNYDGKLLASVGLDKMIVIWDITKRNILTCLLIDYPICAVIFHPTAENYLASGQANGTIKMWKIVKTQKGMQLQLVWSQPTNQTLSADGCQVIKVKNLSKMNKLLLKQRNAIFNSTQTIFKPIEETNLLVKLIVKYKLTNNSLPMLEKGLRNSVVNNQPEDLKIFIACLENVDAQDTNSISQKTALHWAVVKKHKKCVQILLNAGARVDIPDANNKTAYDYARDINDSEILDLFFKQNKLK